MSVHRIMGTETEFGVYKPGDPDADPIRSSTEVVNVGARTSRNAKPVLWDYSGEDPLNDLRGIRLSRMAADPSLLTDDPYHLAPSGGYEIIEKPGNKEPLLEPTCVVLRNGARLYVDHAHPEYSSPETSGPKEATLWDRAGDLIAQNIMETIIKDGGEEIVLVKNNTDGKGASYGAHENYQVHRDVDLDDLIRCLIPFFVTRPVICGTGRVGLGQKSEGAGFQISQRADFIENTVGLETTFNRPIINTRDEPHADPTRYRRLHVIGGDANQFDYSTYLRMGTTSLVLWAIEQGPSLQWDSLMIQDPVQETWNVSHDPHLTYKISTMGDRHFTAVQMQQQYLDLVLQTYESLNEEPDDASRDVLYHWQEVIDALGTDMFTVVDKVEWVAKYQLLARQRERLGADWSDPRLCAMDLQWADLRPSYSLVGHLDRAGRVARLFTPQQVQKATDDPPHDTRAWVRGKAVSQFDHLVCASWTSLVFDDPESNRLIRRTIPRADVVMEDILDIIGSLSV